MPRHPRGIFDSLGGGEGEWGCPTRFVVAAILAVLLVWGWPSSGPAPAPATPACTNTTAPAMPACHP